MPDRRFYDRSRPPAYGGRWKKGVWRSGRSRLGPWPLAWRPQHQDPSGRAWPEMPGPVHLTAGQRGDASQAEALLEGLPADVVMAAAAYDSDRLRRTIAQKEAVAVIPNNPSRTCKHPLDEHLYAQRHLVECRFAKLKQFRRVATRYETTAGNTRAVVARAAIALSGARSMSRLLTDGERLSDFILSSESESKRLFRLHPASPRPPRGSGGSRPPRCGSVGGSARSR